MTLRPLAIAATFTAEPIQQPLEHVLRSAQLEYRVEFAAYNQVMQALLDPTSVFAGASGINVVLIRWEDLGRAEELKARCADLVQAVRDSRAWHLRDLIVCTCPPSPTTLATDSGREAVVRSEAALASSLGEVSGVHVFPVDLVQRLYPVSESHDLAGERLGHVPYTPEWFAAAAMALVRRLHGMQQRAPYKVVVLDCDNTLWRGIVGEDGIQGITLDPAYERLQRFMVAQRESGMLLCLCSKNNEQDAWDAFAAHPEFPLRREHMVDSRINWAPKPDNIREIARDLDLGLDSFIFVDDNAKECAEMRARCPEVLTLLLPDDPDEIPAYLDGVWAFDHWRVTADDRARSAVYEQKLERERLARSTSSFEDFLAGLGLTIAIAPLTPEHLPRVSQLTLRTNQFNTTTVRRSEADVEALLRTGYECLTIDVSDRFGSYGLVGVVIYSIAAAALEVDSFILSCRALGRGVEHRVLAHLGDLARGAGVSAIRVPLVRTAKNEPARSFLDSAGAESREEDGGCVVFAFAAGRVVGLTYRPGDGAAPADDKALDVSAEAGRQDQPRFDYDRLARDLRGPHDVLKALAADRRAAASDGLDAAFVGPRSPIEVRLAAIWAETLGLDAVDVRHSFFDLGGTSLLAVQLVSRVIREFGRESLTLSTVLKAPSVEQFGPYVEFEHLPAYECLVAMRPGGARPPFFFVHGAGGNILSLRSLMNSLPDDQPFYGLQAKGLDGSLPFESVRETAEHYVSEVRRFQPEGPYYIGGGCYGGLVAFEMAQILRDQRQSVGLLAMIDTYNYAYSAMISRAKLLYCNARFVAQRAGHHFAHAATLSPEDRRAYTAGKVQALRRYQRQLGQVLTGGSRNHVAVELAEVGTTAEDTTNYLVQALNRVIQANTRAQREYMPRLYDGTAVLFRASIPFVEPYRAPLLGWNMVFAPGRVDDIVVPGNHYDIVSEPNVRILGRHLDDRLREAQSPHGVAASGEP